LGDIVLAAGRLSVSSVYQQFSQIAADLADLTGGEAMVAQVNTFYGPGGGYSTNQNSHRLDVSTRVTMSIATEALHT
jgi:hypothetical protein